MHSKLLDEIGSMTITSASLPSSAFLKQCDIPYAAQYNSGSSSSRARLRPVHLGDAIELHASAPNVRVQKNEMYSYCATTMQAKDLESSLGPLLNLLLTRQQ
jgi:hypothetical protein